MKKYILLLLFTISFAISMAQKTNTPYISTLFTTDTLVTLSNYHYQSQEYKLIGNIIHDNLYFCRNTDFRNNSHLCEATIYFVNLNNYQQGSIALEIPQLKGKLQFDCSNIWIYSLSFYNEKLVLAIDNHILIYKREGENQYVYLQNIPLTNVCNAYYYQNELYAIIKNHDNGFEWVKISDRVPYTKKTITNLQWFAPFLAQFTPNNYLSITEDKLYFMQTDRQRIDYYNLDGTWLDSISFTIPDNRPIPSAFTQKIMNIPYGAKRIFTALDDGIKYYSYNNYLFPFDSTSFLICYHGYDTVKEKEYHNYLYFNTLYKKQQSYFINKIAPYEILNDELFPIHFRSSLSELIIPYHNRWIQIFRNSNVSFHNKTGEEYSNQNNQFFKDNDAIMQLRVLSLKKQSPKLLANIELLDYDNNPFNLDDLKEERVIIMVNNQPQCSECEKQILKQLNKEDTAQFKLYILCNQMSNYLQKKEKIAQIKSMLQKSFTPLYFRQEQRFEGIKTFPVLILYDANTKQYDVIEANNIFVDNIYSFDFSPSFLEKMNNFLHK